MILGNRVTAAQYIACPLCRCKCALLPSGHFPSCVKKDHINNALDLQDSDIDILDENSIDECITVSSTTQTEQTITDMMIQILHLTLSLLNVITKNILGSVGHTVAAFLLSVIITIIKAPFCITTTLSDYSHFIRDGHRSELVYLCPLMILGLLSITSRMTGCWALQDIHIVEVRNNFLPISHYRPIYLPLSGQYHSSNLYIYTSVVCSVIHRLLRSRLSIRYASGLSKWMHISVNIVFGVLEVHLVTSLPLAGECGFIDHIIHIVAFFTSAFTLLFHVRHSANADLIYSGLFTQINILSYYLSMAIIPILACWADRKSVV